MHMKADLADARTCTSEVVTNALTYYHGYTIERKGNAVMLLMDQGGSDGCSEENCAEVSPEESESIL